MSAQAQIIMRDDDHPRIRAYHIKWAEVHLAALGRDCAELEATAAKVCLTKGQRQRIRNMIDRLSVIADSQMEASNG